MVTIHREGGFRIVIYKDDHQPAHVHVIGPGEAKVNLIGPRGEPAVVWSVGLNRGQLRHALKIVTDRRTEFLAQWRRIHE